MSYPNNENKREMLLAEYLNTSAGLSKETAQQIDDLCSTEELPKGSKLLSEGSRATKVYYVEKGLMRMYYLKVGKDITHDFLDEKMFYAPIENIFLQQPFTYSLEMLESGVIRTVDFSKVEEIIDTDSKLQKFSRFVLVSTIKRLANQLHAIQFQSAQDRYNLLIEQHPNILLRAPLGHIASYLGITQQTLSVIRAGK